jgi:hypothetical protein
MSTEINIKKRIDIQEEGVSITPDVNSINFIGDGVTASAIGDDVTVNIPGGTGTTTYYLNESVTQTPYKEFTSTLTASAEQTIVTSVASGATVTIQSFQTPSGVPGTTNIPGGRWAFYLHFSGTTGDSWDVFAEVYKRDLGGIETLLLTTDAVPTSTLTGAAVMLLTDGVFPASTVLTTDRIVVKVRVTNTDSTTNSITFHTEGNTNYSVATTTLNQVIPTGAVTSVTGTAPVVSSGGAAPAISISQSGTASDGYLSSTDWNTFNNKVDDNIYTADGTVTGTRTVDLDGNTINFNDGKVGVNITPTAPLHVQTIAVPSSNESIARFTVSDAAGAALTILNASSTDGRFVPEISGLQGLNTDNAFKQTSYIQPTQDSGSTPVTVFSTALSTLTAIVTRPLYQFRNAGTSLLTILANGNLGIGTTTPSTPLHVRSTAIPSAGEPIARFDVSDASGYVQIANSTALDGTFGPLIQGRQIGSSTQQAIGLEGVIDVADDTGTVPVTIFQSRLATLVQVVTRPVYQFRNWTLNIMTMLPNGNVGIGTTTPTEKLEVAGKTKTTTFQMTTTPTAGHVLTSDASGNGTWQANGNGTVTSVELSAGTGISLAGTNPITSSGTITVTNSAPDQTVVLNAGTGIGVTGTYPNFTISNTDPTTGVTLASAGGTETLVNDGTGPSLATKGITAGTGISLSSTATDLTVTNAAPDQIVALTAGSGINVTGTYPNFTIDNTGALSDVNIYNSDGTLSADRTVAMNNFGLTFNGAGGSNGSQINISSAANRAKGLNFQVGSGLRWKQQVSGAEIGGDLGSQLAMSYYDDAGVIKGTAFSISRTNGAFRLNNAYSLPTSGGTTGQVLTSTTLGLTEFQALPAEIQAAASDETTNLTIGTSKVTFRMPHAMTLTAVRASLTTAQTAGALLTVDINLNGVSVLGTKLTFDNNERTTVTAATPATIVTSALTDDGEITVDIDAVGTAGARGLKITLIGTRA